MSDNLRTRDRVAISGALGLVGGLVGLLVGLAHGSAVIDAGAGCLIAVALSLFDLLYMSLLVLGGVLLAILVVVESVGVVRDHLQALSLISMAVAAICGFFSYAGKRDLRRAVGVGCIAFLSAFLVSAVLLGFLRALFPGGAPAVTPVRPE
jgi:hypothetical protein